MRIRSILAVENWPERNVPTFFVYKDGELKTQVLAGRAPTGRLSTAEDLEWWLAHEKIVDTEMDENPGEDRRTVRNAGAAARTGRRVMDSDDDADDDDDY